MITKEQVPRVLGHPVYDSSHHKLGEVGHVYVDTDTGEPEWLAIRAGLFGNREMFVPLGPTEMRGDEVLVPFDESKIKRAPRVHTEGGHLPAAEEARLYDYYALRPPTYGRPAGEATDARADERDVAEETGRADVTRAAGERDVAAGTGLGPGQPGMATAPEAGVREDEFPGGRDFRAGQEPSADQPGWRDPDAEAPGAARTLASEQPADQVMTRSEERLRVGTEWRESGRARMHKYVVTEQQQETIPVRQEKAHVVHEPITDEDRDQALAGSRIGESDQEVVLHEERPVLETETVPIERVRLETETVTHQETVGREVRKERIEVEGADDELR